MNLQVSPMNLQVLVGNCYKWPASDFSIQSNIGIHQVQVHVHLLQYFTLLGQYCVGTFRNCGQCWVKCPFIDESQFLCKRCIAPRYDSGLGRRHCWRCGGQWVARPAHAGTSVVTTAGSCISLLSSVALCFTVSRFTVAQSGCCCLRLRHSFALTSGISDSFAVLKQGKNWLNI